MSSFDETFDYLTLLGIDPAVLEVQPPAEVRDLVNRRKKEWTAQAINPLYQQQARANLERARQFEQILDSPDALQAYLGFHRAALVERRVKHDRTVAEFVAVAIGAGRKEITAEQHALLLKACEERGVPADALDATLRARKIGTREDEVVAAAGGAPYRQPALDRALLGQIAGHLKLLGKESFCELLDLPESASPAKIISTARILYDRWSKTLPKTSECVAWEKSLQACLTYLKDGPSKARYDHALYNRRLDEFLARVDLLLASGRFARDDFVLLVTLAVQEFGLPNDVANQCVRWRAGMKGLSLSKPVEVTVSTAGMMKCQRCARHVAEGDRKCRHCGCAFDGHCRNPACGRRLPSGTKICGQCGLSVGRGVQYVELLRLARALLNIGDSHGVLDACRLAEQILPAPQIEELVQRAGKVRTLTTSIRRAAAERRWSRVERELSDLLTLAPQFAQPGCPRLDEVSRFLAQLRTALSQIPAGTAPESEARTCLDVLEKWADSDGVVPRLCRLTDTLEASGRNGPALEIAQRLAELEPLNEEWQVRTVRLQHKLSEEREQIDRISRSHDQFREALASKRLYAADRSLAELESFGAAARAEDAAVPLRQRLADVRDELDRIRRTAQEGVSPDAQIADYVALLERCRDCREAVAALQTLTPCPPAPPESVAVAVQGTRRVIAWRSGDTGGPASESIVQRSVQRPGGRAADASWSTIYDGPDCTFVDNEVLHSGSIVRYSVHVVRRGALVVAGDVLRPFELSSPPVFAEPLLLWQEVLGLRVRRRGDRLELTWHLPAGARQVLIERWIGARPDRPERPELVPVLAAKRALVEPPADGVTVCYRAFCLYDGPAGDFLTPGAIVTLVPGEEPIIETVAEEPRNDPAANQPPLETPQLASPGAAPSDASTFQEILGQAPVAGSTEDRPRSNNPLKRMGLWPPVPKTG